MLTEQFSMTLCPSSLIIHPPTAYKVVQTTFSVRTKLM